LLSSTLIGFVCLTLSGAASAETSETTLIPSVDAVTWAPAPTTLPKGTQIVLLAGDPSKPGPFVLRLKFPPNTTIAAHRHATAENVTALTGHFYHEVGETVDKSKGAEVDAGGFVYLPGMTPHSLWTTDAETIVQVTGTGPFGLLYVDPKDDPSKR
jgi:anti-sigma factor ChrR (cupin superfamily)